MPKGFKHTEETKNKLSEMYKGKNNPFYGKTHTIKWRMQHSQALKGRKFTEEHRRKISESKMGDKNPSKRPEVRKKLRDIVLGRTYEDRFGKEGAKEIKKKLSDKSKRVWQDDVYKKKIKESQKKFWSKTENRKKHGIRLKEMWQNLKLREKSSSTHKKLWQIPEYIGMMMKARNTKPNKAEKQLDKLIQKVTQNFRYNGDFSQGITIGGRIPDFIDCNGQKKIIEMFGRFWHDPNLNREVEQNRTEQATVAHYKKFGFSSLIVWDYELKNPDKVLSKIEEFNRR